MNALVQRRFAFPIASLLQRRLLSNAAPNAADASSVQLSNTCINRLKEICKTNSFLRVAVEGGGCSGFQYKFSVEKQLGDDDVVVSRDGVQVAIDSASIEYLSGATIDYHTELIRSGFRVINNPKADQGCSCGASFTVKLD
ncbi:iron-sulfur cluster assembly 2 homolog, mitochondrial-like [Anopheles stephensi]|nr:iron-sulfur cluster assembly 2 homolog, mitochondrial-like [Anopheles stephensi]XP_035919217.1 iron-sulfur cluster assembly 2 homolog, mitochondrial-like [Anopheles stephensi]